MEKKVITKQCYLMMMGTLPGGVGICRLVGVPRARQRRNGQFVMFSYIFLLLLLLLFLLPLVFYPYREDYPH
jgi:hypothetical protein